MHTSWIFCSAYRWSDWAVVSHTNLVRVSPLYPCQCATDSPNLHTPQWERITAECWYAVHCTSFSTAWPQLVKTRSGSKHADCAAEYVSFKFENNLIVDFILGMVSRDKIKIFYFMCFILISPGNFHEMKVFMISGMPWPASPESNVSPHHEI